MAELKRIYHTDPEWQEFCRIATRAFHGWNPDQQKADPMSEHYVMLGRDFKTAAIGTVHVDGSALAELHNIAVDPARRKQGLGRALMEALEDRLSSRFRGARLMTEEKNIGFYEALGFHEGNSLPNAENLRFMAKRFG